MFLTKKGKIDIKISIYDFLYPFLPMKKRFRIDKTEILGVKKKHLIPIYIQGGRGIGLFIALVRKVLAGLTTLGTFIGLFINL